MRDRAFDLAVASRSVVERQPHLLWPHEQRGLRPLPDVSENQATQPPDAVHVDRTDAIGLLHETPFELYSRLRRSNPAPYGALIQAEGWAVVSSSPERFLHYDPVTRLVETRPIKGTRPRGTDPESDAALARALLASEKDLAEHAMIVDLLRNDLSRVCRPGSVAVPRLLDLHDSLGKKSGRAKSSAKPAAAKRKARTKKAKLKAS